MNRTAISLLVGIGLLIGLAAWPLWSAFQFRPGGGGSIQDSPDVICSGDAATIRLVLIVWGAGGDVRGRYTDLNLQYRLVGKTKYKSIDPHLIRRTHDRETYEFYIPPFPRGEAAELEFAFMMKFDGHPNRVPGLKTVRVISGTEHDATLACPRKDL